MGWAVIQIVEPYHPAGDKTVSETTEFIAWIFEKEEDATKYRADLLVSPRYTEENILVRQIDQEPWTLVNLSKKGKKDG